MLWSALRGKKFYATKTFTYYLPSPPLRKTGYQEKEYDSIVQSIIEHGFEIIDINITSHSSEEKSGVWIVCHIGAQTKEIFESNINFSSQSHSENVPLDPDIVHEI